MLYHCMLGVGVQMLAWASKSVAVLADPYYPKTGCYRFFFVLHMEVIHILAFTTNISEYGGVWTLGTYAKGKSLFFTSKKR